MYTSHELGLTKATKQLLSKRESVNKFLEERANTTKYQANKIYDLIGYTSARYYRD